MARVKISEYLAKKLLLGETYTGVQLRSGALEVPEGKWVAKVDQGVKKRFKQGLIAIDKPVTEMTSAITGWEKKGFSQFLLEPMFDHEQSEEQYLSFERVREGIRIMHTKDGGVDIESNPTAVQSYVVTEEKDISIIAEQSGVPADFLSHSLDIFNRDFFAFMEINPLVVRDGVAHMLDAAVLVDSAGEFFTRAWTEADVIKQKAKHDAEVRVEKLAATTPASLKLSVINPDGALFFLLSGGGGSIVIADEVQLKGAGKLLANYGEYSGGPTREETYLYAKEILALLLASKSKKKALVIAGGVANFTDVKKTFLGIIDAFTEVAPALRAAHVKVFVRRGGPNEAAGLSLMGDFLKKEDLFGSMHGSSDVITSAVAEAISFVQ